MILELLLALSPTGAPAGGAGPEPAAAQEPAGRPEPPHSREHNKRLLAALEERLVEGLYEHRPWLATERGDPRYDHLLGSRDGAAIGRWSRLLEASEVAIETIDRGVLHPSRQLDLDWLRAWVRQERILLAERVPQRRDPLFYSEAVERGLSSLLARRSGADDRRRRDALRDRLAQVPGLWASARASLDRCAEPWTRTAAVRIQIIQELLREGIREWARGAIVEDSEREALAAVLREARIATDVQLAWTLEELPGGTIHPHHLSAERWELLLREATGRPWSTPTLKLMLLRELGERTALIGPHFRPQPGPPSERSPRAIEARVVELSRSTARSALARSIFGPSQPSFEVSALAPGLAWRELACLKRIDIATWRLEIVLAGSRSAEEVRRTREGQLGAAAQAALALRWGPAGELSACRAAAASTSLTDVHFANPVRLEGFGLYATDWAAELQLVDRGDRLLMAELERARLVEAARLLATLQLHGEGESLEEVAARFQVYTGFDPTTSAHEVLACSRDPRRGAGFLAYLSMLDLERELRGEEGARGAAIRKALKVLLANPSARTPDLARQLADGR